MAVGRITGPLLKANLLRDGVDLAFETDLLYLDVINGKVGIKTIPDVGYDLDVNGKTRSTNLVVTNQADLATFTINNNTISSSNSIINLEPAGANAVVYQGKIVTGNLQVSTNTIATTNTDGDLNINTLGTGRVVVNSNLLVNGDIHATGNITADGSIQLGDADTDNIVFNADVNSNIIPDDDITWDLGSDPTASGKAWRNVYAKDILATSVTATNILVDGINLALVQGNIYYVATTGSNSNLGEHEHNPVLTLKYALSLANAGDCIYIYPGIYQEIFPLTVPAGVSIKGTGIRSVKIVPTVGTNDKDAFLMNGETTIEDLTVADYFYNAVNNTGYAFRFATGMTVTTRSPYIRNITVITKGSTTTVGDPYGFDSNDAGKGALADGSVVNAASKEASMLFHSATFITPNQETITGTNGVRIEWLNSFSYFADKGLYLTSGSTGFAGVGQTRLRIENRTGTWAVGNTLNYYDTDGTTVLGTGTIASVSGNYVNLTSKCLGFETITDRVGKTVYAQGDAKLSVAQKKFGTASLSLDGTGDYASVPTQPDFAFPSTISRLAKTITVNGNAAVSATESKFGGSSIAFDGTGDYLSLASDTDYGFGTGDFTIEGWFYKTAVATQYLFDTRTTLTENSVAVQSQGNGTLRLSVNGAFVLTSSNAHTNNAWNHLAISRASGVTRFFINGVVSTTTYTDATNYGTTKPLVVGAQYNGATAFAGYIDDFRVSNTARYTATFTPTTTAFVDDFNTKLLINGDSSIADDVGGTATDFTLEAWIYPTVTTYHSIFDFRSVSTEAAIYLGINLSNQVYLYVNGVVPITTAAISLNVWTHVAVVRSNAITKIYINGTQSGSSWTDITNYGTTKPLRIGAWYNNLYGFLGYIDDVRISKGVARYTANFTAPTSALTGDLGTVLLLHFNGANNSTTFIDDGLTLQDLRTSAGGTASLIQFADYSDFGAELRSIGSASVYGNYGAVGDGDGVIAYLISHNFAYVGTGKVSTNDPNDRIAANEVVKSNRAKIYYTSVDNEGNFSVGDAFFVNQKTGEVLFNGEALTITTPSGVTFTDGVNSTIISADGIDTGNMRISGNTVESLTGDVNVTAASGSINLQNNTFITGNLDVTGDITLGGNITIGDASTDTINFVGGISSNLVPATTATYNLGSSSLRWANVFVNRAEIDGVVIDTNVIETTGVNDNLILQANGSGIISIPSNNVQIDQNLTVTTDLTVTTGTTYLKTTNITGTVTQTGDINQTGNFTTSGNVQVTGNVEVTGSLQLPLIDITDNTISTRQTGTDLHLTANGTGKILVEDLAIEGNQIKSTVTNANITLKPIGSGIVYIDSDQSLLIPVGDNSQRPATPVNGMIRYNNQLGRYEGYNSGLWLTMSGVADSDGNTYITAELTPGANDNTLRFYADGSLMATIDSTKLYAERLKTSNLNIESNTISSISTNSDINLTPTGTGSVRVGNLSIKNNTITNIVSGAITEFTQTGTGYVKVAGTSGIVIPAGTDGTRPGITEAGMIRYNTEQQLVEVYNGSIWTGVSGVGGGINFTDATNIAIEYVLTYG